MRPRIRLSSEDRKSTRLNSSHTVIYTLSLHDALPICRIALRNNQIIEVHLIFDHEFFPEPADEAAYPVVVRRSEEHTSELQSHSDLHSFPTRRSSDLPHRIAE